MTYQQEIARIKAQTERIRESGERFRQEMAVLDARELVIDDYRGAEPSTEAPKEDDHA